MKYHTATRRRTHRTLHLIRALHGQKKKGSTEELRRGQLPSLGELELRDGLVALSERALCASLATRRTPKEEGDLQVLVFRLWLDRRVVQVGAEAAARA